MDAIEEKKNGNPEEAKKLIKQNETLSSGRDFHWRLWEDCLYYFMPEQQELYPDDGFVAEQAQPVSPIGQKGVQTLAAGLFSNTVSMGDQFFGFKVSDPEYDDKEDLNNWLSDAATKCLQYMQASNFTRSMYECIALLCTLNTGCLYTEFDRDKQKLKFTNFYCHNVNLAEDSDGMVNTVFREFTYTACQAYERWGEKNHLKVLEAYKDPNKRYEKFDFIHAVQPRLDRDVKSKMTKDMPFASHYIDVKNKHVVEEGGYVSFPYAIPRFYFNKSNPYGRGVSYSALSTMRELQVLTAAITDGIELKVNPPLYLPSGTSHKDVDNTPGGVNYFNALDGATPFFYQSQIDLREGTERETKKENEVMTLFFADLFLALEEHKNMTATEVAERVAQKLQSISPVVSRMYDELFSPMLLRVLRVLYENDKLDPLPEGFNFDSLAVEYTDKLSQKLDQLEISQILKSVEEGRAILEIQQTLPLDAIIDVDKVVKDIFRRNGVESKYIRKDKETEEARAAQAEQAEAAAAQEAMGQNVQPIDLQKTNENNSFIDAMRTEGIGLTG